MIKVAIEDRAALHQRYMPFVKQGGIFVTGETEHALGEEVALQLSLPDQPEALAITGKVVWKAGRGVKSPHAPGIGVAFGEGDDQARRRIEAYLDAAPLPANTPALTM